VTHRIIAPEFMCSLVDGGRYAPAVLVGDQLHVSGQVGRDRDLRPVTGSVEDHIVAAFENLRAVLAEAGADLSDVFELTTYHVDIEAQMPTFAAVKARYFSDPATLPAWTAVGVPALISPDFRVEISARAHVSR
jgi:enamine deaminase RidA (YjgF/YER057c/UK114 family)